MTNSPVFDFLRVHHDPNAPGGGHDVAARAFASIPDAPTIKEGGVDAEWIQWLGMSVPRKTPAPLAVQIKAMVKKVAEDPAFNKILEGQGAEARYLKSEEVEKFIRDESEAVAKIYKSLLAEEKSRK